MGKYFGTDGVRGIANTELTAELAYKIGRCGGYVLTGKAATKPKVVIGMDTRVSGRMLEASLTAGLLSIGADVVQLGVVTTPAVAYLTRELGADAGVMISASHNPVEDNGIKFFGRDGFKLLDETELEIERLMDAEVDELPRPIGSELGTVTTDTEAKWRYVEYLKSTVKHRFDGLKIVLDCANGAAYELAPRLFRDLGAEVIAIGAEPNGLNINAECGSTHPEHLRREVLKHEADLGLAFDGDADRLIAIDGAGEEVDGDFVLLICGEAMKKEGRLKQDTIVTTVMSNIGFFKAAGSLELNTAKTGVGDRYVMEEMRRGDYNLGGEQSGHVIFLDYNTTGDGMLTGIQLVDTLKGSGKKLSEARQLMRKFPQVLVNVRVEDKSKYKDNPVIEEAIASVERELGDNGRVLVRPSGTESLIRVMAEGPEVNVVEGYVKQIADVILQELSVSN
ncbi:phosphoglucosamine mutase [Paenibacillus thiaminolyticus]|uniref:Phosphoglucosamine mutase n=1 Tax=Paenibacillus thiaminolyticus TaxID=49283 RepID=A0AAP9J1V4_PANTH|nr:phosphoglucosamine mutase [Paenibacillus thiaminolyticus]MCY9536298.1 phosphoglucosamine mutase [Paenibacillus thiaminolyticus]MCY9604360.1 phosphoglucosamine mutase [Paenibacillus thiaminolyticus]MCY9606076.1 phosphoglucosamine mutase [Paenibacillus thiaminolyticus]MCY9615314.1 phosphoglucosamine mutase [Paenibacillus thiaminolyticus]MCY9618010.1 phosphoglucosamine mutase [Paenibacillus thiaminolyticus]